MGLKYEWYTLDGFLRRDTVIEGFESFIWTERYSAAGDFQLITKSTFQNRQLLTPQTMIAMNKSHYVMMIDTVVDETALDGTRNLTVTGRSLEALLDSRVAMPAITDTTAMPAWVIVDTPGNVCRYMFNQICVVGVLNSNDTIPFYHAGSLLPAGNIQEESSTITVSAPPDTLYNTIKKICDTYFLGFRIVRNGEQSQLYFEVYTGNDKTSDQVILDPVIFAPDMDNLEKGTLLTSTAPVKDVAYVFAQNGSRVVYAVGADINATGQNRRVLLINSGNTLAAGIELDDALEAEAQITLANARLIYAFDGELPQITQYEYGVHYSLGDLVEERNADGYGNQMLITEQIFSSDKTGERSYPTLMAKLLITPGTWSATAGTLHWQDEDPSVIWLTL